MLFLIIEFVAVTLNASGSISEILLVIIGSWNLNALLMQVIKKIISISKTEIIIIIRNSIFTIAWKFVQNVLFIRITISFSKMQFNDPNM